jgi:hypothetical protein
MESDALLAAMHMQQTAMAQLVTAVQQVCDELLSTHTMHDELQTYMGTLCQLPLDAQCVVDQMRQAIMQWPKAPTR